MNKFVLTAFACFSFSLLLSQQQYAPQGQRSQEGTSHQYIPPPQEQANYQTPQPYAPQPTEAPQYAPQPAAAPQYAPPPAAAPQYAPQQAAHPTYPVQQYPAAAPQQGINQQYIPGPPPASQPAPAQPPAQRATGVPTKFQPGPRGAPTPPSIPAASTSQKMLDQPLQQPVSNQIYYTEPGIVGYQNGRWIGSDHLYNLPKNLGVIVEIVRLPDVKTSLDEAIIERNVLEMFRQAGFSAYPLTGSPTPPFPYYHVLIITMPIPEGKIAYVSCRLFEQVQLERVQLAEGVYWQAITWEKQTLVQASREEFPGHIYNDVKEITQDFIDRFKHFEELKSRFGQ